jgi:hypothetical protein
MRAVVAAIRIKPEQSLSRDGAARLISAAAVVEAGRRSFAATRGGIFAALDIFPPAIVEWQHHPPGDVYDPQSHAQYFFHVHPPAGRRVGEHGHFHTFLRAEGMPPGAAPLVLPESAVPGAAPPPQAAPLKLGARDEVCHLVAVALDDRGEPVRLFTTNRWVTGETWYRADDVIAMLDRFTLDNAGGPAPVNTWLAALIALYRPQIALLLRERDRTVMMWRQRRRANVFEDPRVEVTSSLDIDLDKHLAALGPLLRRAAPAARQPRLPPMADGWGEGHID